MKPNAAAQRTEAAVRVAVQLAREDDGLYKTVQEISTDALAIADAGIAARRAIEVGKLPDKAFDRAEAVAKQYHAEVIRQGELEGMVLGIRFTSGRFTSGFRNIFFVA